MKTHAFYPFFMAIFFFISCESLHDLNNASCFEQNPDRETISGLEGKWVFLGFSNDLKDENECKPENIREMNIVFSDSSYFSATNACNLIEGTFTTTSTGTLLMQNLGTTLIYCIDEGISEIENDFFDGLKEASDYRIKHDILTIETTGEKDMVFKAN